ncbi:MAG TPA: hypothetical protein VGM47_08025 [Gammaproteobacteria bacterium]|jgi:hypothetical protein
MQDLSQEFVSWQPLFITQAGICATLAGLLFVALSLHAATMRLPQNVNLKRLAENTFSDFILVLFVGLFTLIPGETATVLGVSLLMTVVVVSRPFLGLFVKTLRDREARLHRQHLFWRLGLALLARIFLIIGAYGLLTWHADRYDIWRDLLFVFSGATALMISATRNAWFLLMHELT